MKELKKFALVFIVCEVIIYILFSFVALSFNPITWSELSRIIFVVLTIGAVFYSMAVAEGGLD
jgi:NADH:ubiquinone oxidoreductase subunit 3 (subunit A)